MTTRRNHAAWVGPLLVFSGVISYYTLFVRFPALRDFPWVNLPWVAIGLAVCAWGVRRAFAGNGRLVKSLTAAGFVLSIGLAGVWCWYVFSFSYSLPEQTAATRSIETAPGFELRDQNSRLVSLTDLRGTKVVLVFFRGDW